MTNMEQILKGGELKNIKVKVLSLVDKAANWRELIWKSDKFGTKPNVNYFCEIKKVDDEKHLVYCPVYIPNEKDAHEDWATAETVERAAHDFLAESKTYAIDTNHNMELADGCRVVESAILKGTHAYLPDEKEGTWYVAMEILNKEIWGGVKDGTYKGVSLYGFATRTEDASASLSTDDESAKGFFTHVKKFFTGEDDASASLSITKDFNEQYSKMSLRMVNEALYEAMRDVMYNDLLSIDERKVEMLKVMEQARARLESIEIGKQLVDASAPLSIKKSENMKKLKAAMTVMQEIMDAAESAAEKRVKLNKSKENKTMETIEKSKYDTDIAAKDAEIAKLKKEKEALEKKSPGSKQVDGEPEKPVKKAYRFLS